MVLRIQNVYFSIISLQHGFHKRVKRNQGLTISNPNHSAYEMDSIRNNRNRIDKTDRQWNQSRLVQPQSTQIHALHPYSNSSSTNSSTIKIIKSNGKSNQSTPLVPPLRDRKQSNQLTHPQRTLVLVQVEGGSTSEESGQLPPSQPPIHHPFHHTHSHIPHFHICKMGPLSLMP